ncbi:MULTISPECIES: DUF4351 domain-containing protein [unclassified Clostridium]|jgi:hypothetical protein|uniref:DUF4351 domain-containing protein n=1 Tax=Clostridium TaxID=1485 RepID=UPI001C8CEFE6|nr:MULTISPECIES: DUF4351 domain-containing protein [unclassified Clostridium]MBX9137396.1 DUF4351 domain-containing protein [Clostridium sp. K12(2020)]MBX9144207.1 DUF4351 domain-containing protein [Clostridium sp. K13]MDU2289766.1 DUF4351 domain-containing protein [Clostridium celatum]MDU4324020.1 DUF4351 domain-containing protein [Clostridium celatum]
MLNFDLYKEGVEIGIERGQYLLLIKLLKKKLGKISDLQLNKLEDLDTSKIINVALNIFTIENMDDLNKYLN